MKLVQAKDLDVIITTEQYVVLKMEADRCGPCEKLEEIINNLIPDYPQITFLKMSINPMDNMLYAAANFNIMSVPTTLFFHNGRLTKKIHGLGTPMQVSLDEFITS